MPHFLPVPLVTALCCLLCAAARLDQLLGGVEHVLQVGPVGGGAWGVWLVQRLSGSSEGYAAAP
jgi:hypothetical protein